MADIRQSAGGLRGDIRQMEGRDLLVIVFVEPVFAHFVRQGFPGY